MKIPQFQIVSAAVVLGIAFAVPYSMAVVNLSPSPPMSRLFALVSNAAKEIPSGYGASPYSLGLETPPPAQHPKGLSISVSPPFAFPATKSLLRLQPEASLKIPGGGTGPKALAYAVSLPPAPSRFSTPPGQNMRLPLCGMDRARAVATMTRMVVEGLLDGSLDPRSPQWRPQLADLIANPTKNINPDTVFQLLLAGCEGIDDSARMTVAENWARRFDSGKYQGEVTYAGARYLFNSGNYAETVSRCAAVEKSTPVLAVRAMLLRALSEAYAGDMKQSHRTLAAIKKNHSESPEMPEVRYMEAWLALQEMREDEAKAILKSIVHNTPKSTAATKAAKILESLEVTE